MRKEHINDAPMFIERATVTGSNTDGITSSTTLMPSELPLSQSEDIEGEGKETVGKRENRTSALPLSATVSQSVRKILGSDHANQNRKKHVSGTVAAVRAKYITASSPVGSHLSSSTSSPLGNPVGESGDGGSDSDDDGSGKRKKPDTLPPPPVEETKHENGATAVRDSVQPPAKKSSSKPPGRNSTRPSARNSSRPPSGDGPEGPGDDEPESDEEYAREFDERLARYAGGLGIRYVDPSGYEARLSTFTEEKFEKRRGEVDVARKVLERDFVLINGFLQALLECKSRYEEERRDMDDIGDEENILEAIRRKEKKAKRNLRTGVTEAFNILQKLSLRSSSGKDLSDLHDLKDDIVESHYSPEVERQVGNLVARMAGAYRYKVEADRRTYRSRSFTPDSLASMLGMENVMELLYKKDGTLKTVIDFGCGDGETLILMADEVRKLEEARKWLTAFARHQQRQDIDLTRETARQAFMILRSSNYEREDEAQRIRIDEQIKTRFIGIDQAYGFIDRLTRHKKIGARLADICAPPKEFFSETRIQPGSADITITNLTFDRIHNRSGMMENIALTTKPGGKVVVGLKSRFSAVSDGVSAKAGLLVKYSEDSDWNVKDRIDLLERKVIPLAKRFGLVPVAVGRHPCRVISIDSKTTGPGSGPQNYDLLVVVFEKPAGDEPPSSEVQASGEGSNGEDGSADGADGNDPERGE